MTTNNRKLLHRVERNLFIDQLRHDQTKQGAFDKAMWHLDHPIPGTQVYLAPSDHGEAAEKLYAAIEEAPLWQKLWVKARLSLKPRQRAILDALMVDWRSRPAAKIAGVSQPTVDASKKFLKRISPNAGGPTNEILRFKNFSLFRKISLGYMGDV